MNGERCKYICEHQAQLEVCAAPNAFVSDVFGFKKIGINDDFFDLGGHPLLGTLIISRVNAAFLKDFSLNQMMENPTIANMTKAVACTGEPQVHVQTEARK